MRIEKTNPADSETSPDICTLKHRNRRTGRDRRKFDDPHYQGPERRSLGRRRLSDEIETLFVRLGHFLCRHRITVLIAVFLFVVGLTSMIPQIKVDTSSEALLHKDDSILQEFNQFRDQFGRSELIIIAVEPDEVFSAEFVEWLDSFHSALEEEVPHISEVTSLVNARRTRGEGDALIVESLLEDWLDRKVDWAGLKRQVLANPYYVNNIISEDGKTAAVVIETMAAITDTQTEDDILASFEDTPEMEQDQRSDRHYFGEKENREVVLAVNRVVERFRKPGFAISLSGGPFIMDAFNRSTMQDMVKCFSISIVAMVFFLMVLFRRITGVVLPLMVIVSSVLSTLGLMALFGVPIKITTTVLPAFLVAVGVGDSVHILAIFYRRYQHGCSRREAIVYALGHSGMAIVMTTLTTAAGLLSFGLAELAAIADLGIFAASGVMLALLYTIILLPVLLVILPIRRKTGSRKRIAIMDRALTAFADFSVAHPWKIVIVSALVVILSVGFIFQLKFSDHVVSYFPDDMTVKKDLVKIDRDLKGVVTLEVVVDTQTENGIYDPQILNAVDRFTDEMIRYTDPEIYVGKVFSVNDIVREINQALHGNDSEFYTIPQERDLIAQELLLFENSGSEDLEQVVDSQFAVTRVTIKAPWVDSVIFERFLKQVKTIADPIFSDTADVRMTGGMSLLARTIPAALKSMTRSYLLAFIVITFMMMLLVENVKLGLISMIPNLLPIITIMGVMGMARVPLDMTTLMIGSIALGLVVDDTVHFMYNFRRYYEKRKDAYQAIRETLLGTGRALLITSLVLSFGFFSNMFATLTHIRRFGLFTGLTILLALLADFLLAPALMVVLTRRREREMP